MKIDIQRLRTLTTGLMHTTDVGHVYQDIEAIAGVPGIMTHQIPNAMRALEPWLREKITDPRFWDGQFDQSHIGEIDLPAMTDDEQREMLQRYEALPNPLAGKEVLVVKV